MQVFSYRFGLVMKILLLFLIITIGAQPLQAGFCDMETDQDTAHHMNHHEGGEKPCCESDPTETQIDCSSEMQCGFCNASVSTVLAISNFNVSWLHDHSGSLSSGVIALSHSSPPFRPPIS